MKYFGGKDLEWVKVFDGDKFLYEVKGKDIDRVVIDNGEVHMTTKPEYKPTHFTVRGGYSIKVKPINENIISLVVPF